MKVAITGGTGFIGSALTTRLRAGGHEVLRVTRSEAPAPGDVHWDPTKGEIEAARLEGVDAVVHLAGESIGSSRWTERQKARILHSRVNGTTLLCEAIAGLRRRPATLVSGSGINYYGDRGDEIVTETSPPGTDFLADVCVAWETATRPAADAGIRVVNTRTGLVVAGDGGFLPRMLLPFKLGLGGPLGSGNFYWSWIAIDDVTGGIVHLIGAQEVNGPANLTSPTPVTNAEFTKSLGRVLGRPTFLPVPPLALSLVLGAEMTEAMLLASMRVRPEVLQRSGYRFEHSDIEAALRRYLKG